MPVLDGFGVVRALRARGLQIPTIVVTSSDHAREWAEAVHAAAFLTKPFAVTELVEAVSRAVRIPRQSPFAA
jgi:two-component system response regulator PrrA